jgi:hypothetical protein
MSVRRRQSRSEIVNAEGVMRVVRDVTVRRTERGELVALSAEAGISGEILTIHFASDGNTPVPVRVIGSKPVMVDGSLRHELRLTSLDGEPSPPRDAAPHGDVEAE